MCHRLAPCSVDQVALASPSHGELRKAAGHGESLTPFPS
jgi:hypothetical protein